MSQPPPRESSSDNRSKGGSKGGPEGLDATRWTELCGRLIPAFPFEDVHEHFQSLVAAYDESHRTYHNVEHILECLEVFDSVRKEADSPDELEFALWLHDAIYRTRGSDSEAKSADWAQRILEAGGADAELVGRVRELIMVTLHSEAATEGDAALMVDIDLSILGRDDERFDRYEADVRREYRWVPGPLFRSKRREMLKTFLARPVLFQTPRLRERLEDQARRNLQRSIERLGG